MGHFDQGISITARGFDIMEEEADAFIGRVFDEWARGHFGKRLERELGVDDGTSELSDEAIPAEEGPTLEAGDVLPGEAEDILASGLGGAFEEGPRTTG